MSATGITADLAYIRTAIINVVGSRASLITKAIWVIVILALPVLGLLIWLVAGPRAAHGRG